MPGGIIVLTDQQDRHGYFVRNLVNSGIPVQGVITGTKRRLVTKQQPVQIFTEPERRALKVVKHQRHSAQERYFADDAKYLEKLPDGIWLDHVRAEDGDVNNPRFVERIIQAKPEAIVVMGATMLRGSILNLSFPIVNMHTGLSPYYRGGRSNMWPILQDDYGYFGVTIHRIAPGIDDGNILVSERILVEADDTYPTINARAVIAGTASMVRVLQRLQLDKSWSGVDQWTKGKLFLDRDYTARTAQAYIDRQSAYIAEHLYRQQRGQLDDIRLIALSD